MESRRIAAERRFRELLESAGLPSPDETIHAPDEILFLWTETKTPIVLELDDSDDAEASCGEPIPWAS